MLSRTLPLTRTRTLHRALPLFLVYPRADGAKRRARVLIPPRLFIPGETKALAKSKVNQ